MGLDQVHMHSKTKRSHQYTIGYRAIHPGLVVSFFFPMLCRDSQSTLLVEDEG